MEPKIMGLDYGAMTVGVAVSDDLLLTAQGLEVIRREHETKLRRTLQRIEALIAERGVNVLLLGYPKHLNNTAGERARKTEEFAETLRRRTGLPVVLWDERLSTVAAERVLKEGAVSLEKRKQVVDQVAAAVILQSYLDYLAIHPEQKQELKDEINER